MTCLSIDLDTIVEIFLKVSAIKNAVSGWLGVIDDELVLRRGGLAGSCFGLIRRKAQCKPTETGTQQSDTRRN